MFLGMSVPDQAAYGWPGCTRGMTRAMSELSEYRGTHPEFEAVGEKMIFPDYAQRRAISEK
ncbi:hypothetical protein BFW89_21370 [Pseudomonas synxantha]|nr:hypothetical protein BFW89_21370 [Pseudomonas synxantha]